MLIFGDGKFLKDSPQIYMGLCNLRVLRKLNFVPILPKYNSSLLFNKADNYKMQNSLNP